MIEENISLFLGNILVVSGSFLLLIFLIKKFAWKNIQGIFEKRAQKISDDIDEAENLRDRAEMLTKEREKQLVNSRQEASTIIQNAKDSASLSRQNMLKEAEEEVMRKKEQAKQDIEQSKLDALKNVKGDVTEISMQLVSKILDQELNQEGHQNLINSFVEKLGDGNVK
ncbi:MAG: F0F1 ATP synthase subunit B [Streptococcaceae bacterium]|jgi:F-type H+-transporting ATPase subunit b|nr:F0F1 ATP synthase subunit B [Streptococcaceae bacterium]